MGYKWRPLVRSDDTYNAVSDKLVKVIMQSNSLDEAAARKLLDDDIAKCETWVNEIYQVQLRRREEDGLVHLNIRRRDGAPIIRDWRHLQLIKNQLLGEECEAVELYPAESRKVDTSNKYHLYGYQDAEFRFPFGWQERDVLNEENRDTPGMRQRPY
jgi:hypothetical protein